MNAQQFGLLAKAMSKRIERAKLRRKQQFEKDVLDSYMKEHSDLAKEISEQYKKNVVDKAIVEIFCSEERYRTKNKKLIERSKAKDGDWIQLKDMYQKKIQKKLAKTLEKDLPESVRQSILDIN